MKTQSGNAFFLILIAIFLLGAVTAMLVRSGGTSEETGDTERTIIKATELIRYAAAIKTEITNMRSRGCSENQINFSAPAVTSNPNAPADGSCSVFSSAKGSIKYINMEDSGFQTVLGPYYANQTFFNGNCMAHPDAGQLHSSELTMFVAGLDKNLCMQINRVLGIENPNGDAPDATATILGGDGFIGAYVTGIPSNRFITSAGGELEKKMTGCAIMSAPSDPSYTFYSVLIAR